MQATYIYRLCRRLANKFAPTGGESAFVSMPRLPRLPQRNRCIQPGAQGVA